MVGFQRSVPRALNGWKGLSVRPCSGFRTGHDPSGVIGGLGRDSRRRSIPVSPVAMTDPLPDIRWTA